MSRDHFHPDEFSQDNVIKRHLNAKPTDIPDFSAGILSQLQDDLANPLPCEYDFEFVSAYSDWPLSCIEPGEDESLRSSRMNAFEAHLPSCQACTKSLWFLNTLKDGYQNRMRLLERSLEDYDVSLQVLQAYTQSSTTTNVLPFTRALQPKRVMLGSIAAAVLGLLVMASGILSPGPSKPQAVNVAALESALMEDAREKARQPENHAVRYSVYESPEAYLFSQDTEELPDDILQNPNLDVSAVLMEE